MTFRKKSVILYYIKRHFNECHILESEWCVLVSIWSSFGFVVDGSLVGICCGFWFVLLILIVLYVLLYQIMLSFFFYFPFPLNKRNWCTPGCRRPQFNTNSGFCCHWKCARNQYKMLLILNLAAVK